MAEEPSAQSAADSEQPAVADSEQPAVAASEQPAAAGGEQQSTAEGEEQGTPDMELRLQGPLRHMGRALLAHTEAGAGAMLAADSTAACSAIRCAATAATSGGLGFTMWYDQGTTPERLAALAASQASTTRVRGLHARRPRRAAVVYTSGTA